MCVIIHRLPGIVVPSNKIESACTVNADGFGLAISDRGKIELIKELNPKGNDPERILKLLEDAKDLPVLLHLRFKTVGEINDANCHPFIVTTDDEDGMDIVMAHNGTMSNFNITGNDFSDSYMFNEMICRPMFERALISPDVDPEAVLDDELIQLVLNEFIPSSSIVSFMDGFGKTLHIHEANGFEHEGWWSSNNYSFNQNHRVKSVTTFQGHNSGRSYYDNYSNGMASSGWPAWDDQESPGAEDANIINGTCSTAMSGRDTVPNPSLPVNTPTTYDDTDEERNAGRKAEAAKITATLKRPNSTCPSNSMLRLATADRATFASITGTDLRHVCRLESEDISELVHFYPEMTVVLIKDLLKELWLRPHVEMVKKMDAKEKADAAADAKAKTIIAEANAAVLPLPGQDLVLAVLKDMEMETVH
jgi:hypothetical protein